jgi:hypothetical protein
VKECKLGSPDQSIHKYATNDNISMTAERKTKSRIHIIDLEAGKPSVHEALAHLDFQLANARRQGRSLLKLIHGYGSTGAGGDIRIAIQKRLHELERSGTIRRSIFGEDWGTSNAHTWELLKAQPALKQDPDLGRRNLGITIVLL